MKKMLINGELVESSSGEVMEVENPATEEIIDTVPAATKEELNRAVRAAFDAKEEWRRISPAEKAGMLHKIASEMKAQREELAKIQTLELGRPYPENLDEVDVTAMFFDYYAELGQNERGRVVYPNEANQIELVVKEPFGVVGAIIPWNFPYEMIGWKVAPALAAGNTVVLKPASYTPLTALAFARICNDILPAGVLNVVTGPGQTVGEALASHENVDLITITGSTEVGKRVMKLASDRVKKVGLELGGNDAFIVCEDAPIDVAVKAGVWAAFFNAGQVCTSAKRFFVVKSISDEYIDKFVQLTKGLKIGNGMDEGVNVGPMVSAEAREQFASIIEDTVRSGAKLLTGGKIPEGMDKGYFYLPTVLTELDRSMRIMQEEAFGPAAPIVVVKNLDEAIKWANDTEYGLGAAVFTESLRNALRARDELEAGNIWINDPIMDNVGASHGGVKMSGIGREMGIDGLDEFRYSKRLHLDYTGEAKAWWY